MKIIFLLPDFGLTMKGGNHSTPNRTFMASLEQKRDAIATVFPQGALGIK